MALSLTLGVLKRYVSKRKSAKKRKEMVDRSVRQIKKRHELGYRGQAKAKDPAKQQQCIEAQIRNGHTPAGMTQDDVREFIMTGEYTEDE